jgi:DNA (cytosine-5)-methyltransferase 1
MTKYKEWKLDDSIGLLVGGTPCQSFSVAGLRKGLEDPRGNLALTYVGILDKFRPKWCIWENVPGVLSSGGGRDFGAFLGALAELGYGFAYRVLDAQNFGVAQRRRRVFVVGCLGGWESAAKVLFESESLSGNIKQGKKTRKNITKYPPDCVGTLLARDYKGLGSFDHDKMIVHAADKCPTITASGSGYSRPGNAPTEHETYIAYAMQGNLIGRDKGGPQGIGVSDSNTMYTLTKTDVHAVATSFNVNARPDEMKFLEEQSNTLTTSQNLGVFFGCFKSGQSSQARSIGWSEKVSPTLPANAGGNTTPAVLLNMAVRRLTEIECERLQGFPDSYTDIKSKNKPTPDGPRYKALGNSMAVPVMAWIGQRIEQVEAICKQNK